MGKTQIPSHFSYTRSPVVTLDKIKARPLKNCIFGITMSKGLMQSLSVAQTKFGLQTKLRCLLPRPLGLG